MNLFEKVFDIEAIFYGNSLIFRIILYVLLLYLFFKGGNFYHKVLLRYTVLVLCIIYNPLIIYLCDKILGGIATDVRLFYLLPIFPICAYGMTSLIFYKGKLDYKSFVLFILLIILSGKTFLSQRVYSTAENLYKIPQEVVDVCEIIDQDASDKSATVPNELIRYIRRYDSRIELCYDEYSSEGVFANGIPSEEEFEKLMQEKNFNYIVYYRDDIEMVNMFNQYGYLIIGETDNYVVLKK